MFKEKIPLKNLTSLKVGGLAEYFVSVGSEQELMSAVEAAKQQKLPITVIGGGTNVLVPDEGLPGLIIQNNITGRSEQVKELHVLITAGAGETLDRLVDYTVSKNYWGLENLSHIPGSVGATPVQNVGAYGVEIGDLITAVRVLNTQSMIIETLSAEQCQFGYRDSIFKHDAGSHYIVIGVVCKLSTLPDPKISYKDLAVRFGDSSDPSIKDIRQAVIEIRSQKFPDWTKVGTAGSFFKNPIVRRADYEKLQEEYPGLPGFDVSDTDVKIPLGWILDNVCNLRGVSRGKVGTYKGQALVVVHDGTATAAEVVEFAKFVESTVLKKTGINIEWEVTQLG